MTYRIFKKSYLHIPIFDKHQFKRKNQSSKLIKKFIIILFKLYYLL